MITVDDSINPRVTPLFETSGKRVIKTIIKKVTKTNNLFSLFFTESPPIIYMLFRIIIVIFSYSKLVFIMRWFFA